MSDKSINFRATDVGVSSFMDNIKQKSTSMTNALIKDAQKQTDIAKEQLQLVERQIAAQQRKARLEGDAAVTNIKQVRDSRISNIDRRGETIDLLGEQNKARFKAGEIPREEYLARRKRIDALGDRNTESVIVKETAEGAKRIKEESHQNEVLARYMKENVEAVKIGTQQEVLQMRKGDDALINAVDENAAPTERLTNQLASQQFLGEKDEEKTKGRRIGKDMLDLANAITLEKVGSMIANIPNTKNELDFVKPMMSAAGMLAGGLAGSAVDAVSGTSILGFSLGQTSLGPLGAQLGEKLGEFAGSAIDRSFKSREVLSDKNYRLQALVGRDMGISAFQVGTGGTGMSSVVNQDLSKYGLNYSQVSDLQYEIAGRKGSSRNLGRDSENVAALEEGIGVRRETSFTMLELLRSNKESDKNLMSIVGGVLQKGQGNIFKDGDRSFLNEFLTRNYTQLQKTLLSTQGTVASGTTFDILRRFNNIGGQFSAQDSRSSGLINQIQGSLANPGSDNLKALAFTVMRRNNPKLGLAGLLEEQQKGLASPSYMKSMLEAVDQMGGDKDMKIMNVAGMFGLQGNLNAARRIYENRRSLTNGKISVDQLKGTGQYGEEGVRDLAKSQVNQYTASTAEIENAFIESAVKGVKVVGEKMKGLMGDMMDGMQVYVKSEIAKITGTGPSKPRPNQTIVHGTGKSREQLNMDRGHKE